MYSECIDPSVYKYNMYVYTYAHRLYTYGLESSCMSYSKNSRTKAFQT